MVIFARIRGPVGGVISGGKGPVIPSPLQNKKAGGAKANTNLTKIVTNLNKIKKEIKTLQEIISSFIRNLQIPSRIIINFPWPAYTLAEEEEEKEERRRRREERRERRKEKKRRRERRER